MTNGTVPIEWIEEKPQKVWEFLEKQRPYWPPGEDEKSWVTFIKVANQVNLVLSLYNFLSLFIVPINSFKKYLCLN